MTDHFKSYIEHEHFNLDANESITQLLIQNTKTGVYTEIISWPSILGFFSSPECDLLMTGLTNNMIGFFLYQTELSN